MIIVLGAPRTGTTSCARALEQLNLQVLQYCPITKSDTKLAVQSILVTGSGEYDAVVSSHVSEVRVAQWISNFRDATFIHCTRNETDRRSSLNALGRKTNISTNELSRITNILKTGGKYFRLDCDWSSRMKWQTLHKALTLDENRVPENDYPHSNTSVMPQLQLTDPVIEHAVQVFT